MYRLQINIQIQIFYKLKDSDFYKSDHFEIFQVMQGSKNYFSDYGHIINAGYEKKIMCTYYPVSNFQFYFFAAKIRSKFCGFIFKRKGLFGS